MTPTNRIQIWQGDITDLEVDAIVNAANPSLLGGGGVDGAIHRAAGPELASHCRGLGGCETGDAKLTPGFRLSAPFVIHTVGPVWHGGTRNEETLLASCYRRCLELASAHHLRTIAFPAISTGIFGFPADLASRIALREVHHFLSGHDQPESVTLVAFDAESLRHLLNARDASLGEARS